MSTRNRILENFSLKIIAFVLSLGLVVFVRGDVSAVETYDLTVLVRVPQGHILASAREVPVRVKVRGKWSQLQELGKTSLGPISVTVPANPGANQIFLSPDLLQLPPGLTVESFEPSAFQVILEEEIYRTVPVAVEDSIIGKVPPGFRVAQIQAVPQAVELIGPRNLVDDIDQVLFEPINLSGRTRTFVEQKEVIPARFGVQVNGVSRISVRVEIASDAQRLVASGVPVVVLELSKPYEVLPEHLDIVLAGTDEALAKVDEEALAIVIDGSKESDQPPRSLQKRITRANIPNLPSGVTVDETTLHSVILRTFAEPPPSLDGQDTDDQTPPIEGPPLSVPP